MAGKIERMESVRRHSLYNISLWACVTGSGHRLVRYVTAAVLVMNVKYRCAELRACYCRPSKMVAGLGEGVRRSSSREAAGEHEFLLFRGGRTAVVCRDFDDGRTELNGSDNTAYMRRRETKEIGTAKNQKTISTIDPALSHRWHRY